VHYNFAQVNEERILKSNSLYASKTGLKGVILLSEVKIGENDSFETALKRFNRKIQQDGILAEARRREHYEKPSVKRKRKEAAKRRKAMRKGQ